MTPYTIRDMPPQAAATLADLAPGETATIGHWRHLSDLTGGSAKVRARLG